MLSLLFVSFFLVFIVKFYVYCCVCKKLGLKLVVVVVESRIVVFVEKNIFILLGNRCCFVYLYDGIFISDVVK